MNIHSQIHTQAAPYVYSQYSWYNLCVIWFRLVLQLDTINPSGIAEGGVHWGPDQRNSTFWWHYFSHRSLLNDKSLHHQTQTMPLHITIYYRSSLLLKWLAYKFQIISICFQTILAIPALDLFLAEIIPCFAVFPRFVSFFLISCFSLSSWQPIRLLSCDTRSDHILRWRYWIRYFPIVPAIMRGNHFMEDGTIS